MTARLRKIEEHLNMASQADIHLCKLPLSLPHDYNQHRRLSLTSLQDTAATPNGIKVSILLEELGLSYQVSIAEALAVRGVMLTSRNRRPI